MRWREFITLFSTLLDDAGAVQRSEIFPLMSVRVTRKAALEVPEVQKSYAALGLDPFESSPANFKNFLAEQVRLYADLVKIAGIEPQ